MVKFVGKYTVRPMDCFEVLVFGDLATYQKKMKVFCDEYGWIAPSQDASGLTPPRSPLKRIYPINTH